MYLTGAQPAMRLAPPTHKEWVPSDGQRSGLDFMLTRDLVALWADPGAGKTTLAFAAFGILRDHHAQHGERLRMLVVGTRRIIRMQWRQEAKQWTQFKDFSFGLLHGDKKDKVLEEDHDIYLCTYAGLKWLHKRFAGKPFPFQIVCADEATKIKNAQSDTSKFLRKLTANTRWKWAMTGTPNPNGYEDLFGQFLWLDGGWALGKFISHFRDMYMKRSYNGFDWELQSSAAARIEERIACYVFRLPYPSKPLINDIREIQLPDAVRRIYKEMAAEGILSFDDGVTVTAANAGALQSKLSQIANGAVYYGYGEARQFKVIHSEKLDDLEDLIDELNGKQLLVAYEFEHDLKRLLERFPNTPWIGGGTSDKSAEKIQDDWNAGKIPLLFAHPASVGHGLNLQRGGACHIYWFSITWDFELWDQFIRRLLRQGNPSDQVINHIPVVKGTIDRVKLDDKGEKRLTMAQLLQRMHEILQGVEEPPGDYSDTEDYMSQTLGFQQQPGSPAGNGGWGQQAPAPQNQQPQQAPPQGWAPQAPAPQQQAPAPQGWGQQTPQPPAPQPSAPPPPPGGWAAPAAPQEAQRQQIQQQIAPPPPPGGWAQPAADPAMQAFSPEVQQQAMNIQQSPENRVDPNQAPPAGAEAQTKTTRTRSRSAKNETADSQTAPLHSAALNTSLPTAETGAFIEIRISGNDPAALRNALRALLG